MPSKEKRLKDAKAAAEEADFRVLRIMWGVTIPRVSRRYTPGYEPLAALGHSTFQVVLRSFLPRIFTDIGDWFYLGFPQI
ncbi:MAG: hypothetical protein KIG52_06430 [Muribaculaceae bacterium]|nr:hypothetical protein [Muribaculaceae bacterium]